MMQRSFPDGNTFTALLCLSGFSVFAELPAMDDLKAEAKSQLEETLKNLNCQPTECMSMLRKVRQRPYSGIGEEDPRSYDHHCFHRPDITTYLLGSNAAAVVRPQSAPCWLCADTNARTLLRAFDSFRKCADIFPSNPYHTRQVFISDFLCWAFRHDAYSSDAYNELSRF